MENVKNNKSKRLFVLLLCFMLFVCYLLLYMHPIIVFRSKLPDNYNFIGRKSYNPVVNIDFSTGKNEVIIYTSFNDVSFLPEQIKKSTLLYSRNNNVIECIKDHFKFERVSDDFVETTESESFIVFIKDGQIVFKSRMMIENGIISLKFKNTGWTFAQNNAGLLNCFSQLNRRNVPILIIGN